VSGDDDLGPVPTRFPAEVGLVRRLIAAQFPQWADLPIRRVATEGWDNRTFHLGDAMTVRLPSAEPYALAVEKEHRWLPVLAPQLPQPTPVPLGKGRPGEVYPHSWSVYAWLPGEVADHQRIPDLTGFAVDLGTFLAALQRVDATGGPGPGLHNWYRGGPLTRYDQEVERALEVLGDQVDIEAVRELWESARNAAWDGRQVWFHGDIAVGNLLIRESALAAVIDFGTCGVGDPACDLAIAWTLFDQDSRAAFIEVLGADPAAVTRGQGWALWKSLAGYAGAVRSGNPPPTVAAHALTQLGVLPAH
jgi:aminoglycoside phosphotransferase (APT) family kinase protein